MGVANAEKVATSSLLEISPERKNERWTNRASVTITIDLRIYLPQTFEEHC